MLGDILERLDAFTGFQVVVEIFLIISIAILSISPNEISALGLEAIGSQSSNHSITQLIYVFLFSGVALLSYFHADKVQKRKV